MLFPTQYLICTTVTAFSTLTTPIILPSTTRRITSLYSTTPTRTAAGTSTSTSTSTSPTTTLLPDANLNLFLYEKLIHSSPHHYKTTFHNKRVWITGASSGLGEEMAKQLYDHGAKLILSGRNVHELERIREELLVLSSPSSSSSSSPSTEVVNQKNETNDYKNVEILPFDITTSTSSTTLTSSSTTTSSSIDTSIKKIVQKALHYYNGIDILILNAGVGQLSPSIEEKISSTKHIMDVNFYGPIQLSMEVIQQDKWGQPQQQPQQQDNNSVGDISSPSIPKRTNKKLSKNSTTTTTNSTSDQSINIRQGHIVYTASVASKLPIPLGSSYAASKHASYGYFTSLRSECQPWLRVDLPCPGPIQTMFQTKALEQYYNGSERMKNDDMNTSVLQKGEGRDNKDNNNYHDDDDQDDHDSNSEVAMSIERCATLIIAGMSGPRTLMQETWISKQPTLFFIYLNQYFPILSHWILGIVGYLRVKAFKAGLPLYKVSSWIQVLKNEKDNNSNKATMK